MAPSLNLLSFFFLLSFLLSQEAQARSFFFSKVANVDNLNSEEVLPHKVTNVVNNKQEKEPTFIPQNQNGYGLYGHDSNDQSPSSTNEARNDESLTSTHYINNNNFYNHNYETNDQNEMSDTRLAAQKRGYTTNPSSQNSYYDGERQGMSDTRFTTTPTSENSNNNNYYNVEKQGMSDTRFLENGKYYYDLESENNYNQKNQYNTNSQVLDSRNWYNNNNNNKRYYGSNNNRNQKVINYENNDVYQNEEFLENEDDQFVP